MQGIVLAVVWNGSPFTDGRCPVKGEAAKRAAKPTLEGVPGVRFL